VDRIVTLSTDYFEAPSNQLGGDDDTNAIGARGLIAKAFNFEWVIGMRDTGYGRPSLDFL